jgi:hypothetical protein
MVPIDQSERHLLFSYPGPPGCQWQINQKEWGGHIRQLQTYQSLEHLCQQMTHSRALVRDDRHRPDMYMPTTADRGDKINVQSS